jgi:hypothetical protein
MKDEGITNWYLTIFRKFTTMKVKIGILLYIKKVCNQSHKNPIKDQWLKPSHGKQKVKAKERPKDVQLPRTKKREKANPFRGRKLSHP